MPESLPNETRKPIKACLESQNQLTTLLAQCFLMQKGYGEKAEDALTRDAGFQWILGDYDIEQVKAAFLKYVKTHSDMPAPADIINIINPPPPKIDWPLYIELKKRLRQSNVYVDQDERAFVRNCENLAILRQKNEMQNYADAQRQLEGHFSQLTYDGD